MERKGTDMKKREREEQIRTRCRMAIVGIGLAICMIPMLVAPAEEPILETEPTETETEIIQWKEDAEEVSVQPMQEGKVSEPAELVSLGEFKLTAYCSCKICCKEFADDRPKDDYGNDLVFGASGVLLEQGVSIAVDPAVIQYGTKVIINGHGEYIAQDTGSVIVGNKIDVYFDNHEEARNFGEQYAEVFLAER